MSKKNTNDLDFDEWLTREILKPPPKFSATAAPKKKSKVGQRSLLGDGGPGERLAAASPTTEKQE